MFLLRRIGVGFSRFLALRFAYLSVQFLGQPIDLALGTAQCFRFLAQNTLGCALNAFAEPANALVGDAHRAASLSLDANIDKPPGHVDRVFYSLLMRFANCIIKLSREQRLRLFCLFDRLPHLLQ